MNQKIKTWCEEKNFKIDKNLIYGKVKDVYFSITPAGNFTLFSFNMNCPSQNLESSIKEALKEKNKKIPRNMAIVKSINIPSNLIVIRVAFAMSRYKPEFLEDTIDTIINEAIKLGGAKNEKCIHCGKDTNNHVIFNQSIQTMCEDCVSNLDELNKNNQTSPTSYVTGLIGALIGAIVGGIPWVILLFNGWIVGVLAFIIGICSFTLYKFFKGPKSRVTANIIIYACSFISVVAWLIFVYGYTFMEAFNFEESFKLDYLFQDAVLPYFLRDLGVSLFIALLGLLGIHQKITTYTIPKTPKNVDL